MRRIVLAAVAALCALLAAQPAAAQAYAARALRMSVNLADLKAIVASMPGHKVEEERIWGEGDEADVSLRATDAEGLIYVLVGTACEPSGCSGVMMQVRYNCDAIDYAKLNAANVDRAAVTVWYDSEEKMLGVTRYMLLDHGVTMQNLRENLVVLLELAGDAADAALGQGEDEKKDEATAEATDIS
ncbi:YbjN domain-containing protein [Novosphingobium soli]|uniref:YbjN domain-containing protein n=1 Tax=Novosphingobium soli TaxID=574956 RepID=A0ABV6CVV8_9SPHN